MTEVSKELKISLKGDVRGAEEIKKALASIHREAGELGKIFRQVDTGQKDGGFASLAKVVVKHQEELKKMGVLTKDTLKVFQEFNEKAIKQQIRDLSELDKKLQKTQESLERWKKRLAEATDDKTKMHAQSRVALREQQIMQQTLQRGAAMEQLDMLGKLGGPDGGLFTRAGLARLLGIAGAIYAGGQLLHAIDQAGGAYRWDVHTRPLTTTVRGQTLAATRQGLVAGRRYGAASALADEQVRGEVDQFSSAGAIEGELMAKRGLFDGIKFWNREARIRAFAHERAKVEAAREKWERSGRLEDRLAYENAQRSYRLFTLGASEARRLGELEYETVRRERTAQAYQQAEAADPVRAQYTQSFFDQAMARAQQNRLLGSGFDTIRNRVYGLGGEAGNFAAAQSVWGVAGARVATTDEALRTIAGLGFRGIGQGTAAQLFGSLAIGASGNVTLAQKQTAQIMGEAFAQGLEDSRFLEELARTIIAANRTSGGVSGGGASIAAMLSSVATGRLGTEGLAGVQATMSASQAIDQIYESGGRSGLERVLRWEGANRAFAGTGLDDYLLKSAITQTSRTDLLKAAEDMSQLAPNHRLWAVFRASGMGMQEFQSALRSYIREADWADVYSGVATYDEAVRMIRSKESGDWASWASSDPRMQIMRGLQLGDHLRGVASLDIYSRGRPKATGAMADLTDDSRAGIFGRAAISDEIISARETIASIQTGSQRAAQALRELNEEQRKQFENIGLTRASFEELGVVLGQVLPQIVEAFKASIDQVSSGSTHRISGSPSTTWFGAGGFLREHTPPWISTTPNVGQR